MGKNSVKQKKINCFDCWWKKWNAFEKFICVVRFSVMERVAYKNLGVKLLLLFNVESRICHDSRDYRRGLTFGLFYFYFYFLWEEEMGYIFGKKSGEIFTFFFLRLFYLFEWTITQCNSFIGYRKLFFLLFYNLRSTIFWLTFKSMNYFFMVYFIVLNIYLYLSMFIKENNLPLKINKFLYRIILSIWGNFYILLWNIIFTRFKPVRYRGQFSFKNEVLRT